MGGGTGSARETRAVDDALPRRSRSGRGLQHEPGLDGLRGLAVAGVLLFHGGIGWATGGFLGVSTFFTLSGFLITTLLLREHSRNHRIDLGHFWSRRARRLLPAALVALSFAFAYAVIDGSAYQFERIRGDVVAALLYSENWRLVLTGRSYLALFSAPSPVEHFWSLAIEEQFYVVFPILAFGLLALGRGSRRLLAVAVGALAVASLVAMLLLHHPGADPSRVYFGTDTRAFELLVGVLLALALARGIDVGRTRPTRLAVAALGVIGLVVTLAAWGLAGTGDEWLYRGGLAAYAIASACVILAATCPGPVHRLLSVPALQALGRISYGVYLYHWPIFLWLDGPRTGLSGAPLFLLRVAVTLGVAALSHRYLEQPIREGRRITGWRPWLVAPAGAVALGAFVLLAPIPSPEPPIVLRAVRPATEVAAARATNPAAPNEAADASTPVAPTDPSTTPTLPAAPAPVTRVMVIGDSVAQTLGRGIERWGARNGIQVVNDAHSWCGILHSGNSITGPSSGPSCDQWSDWSDTVERFRPDVIVALSVIWDVTNRQWNPGEPFLSYRDPVSRGRWVGEYRDAARMLSRYGARVVLLEPPCDSTDYVDRAARYVHGVLVPMLLAPGDDLIRTVDLNRYACPAGTFTDQIGPVADARPDGRHFSDPGADWVADRLMPDLLRTATAPGATPAAATSIAAASAAAPSTP